MLIDQLNHETDALLKTTTWLTPLNLADERIKFLASPNHNPQIVYPEMPTDQLKNQLQKLEQVDNDWSSTDLTAWVSTRRKKEQEFTILMLINRGNSKFGESACELVNCTFNSETIASAKVDAASLLPFETKENKTSAEVISGITKYLQTYGVNDWSVELSEQTDFYFRVKAQQKRILIGSRFNWDFTDFDCMLAHEIDGHVLRGINSTKQQDLLLQKSLPFYIKTEEGLASFLGDYCSTSGEINRKHHALKYLAGQLAITSSFKMVFEFLVDNGFTPDLAFQRTFRLKRGLTDTGIPGCYGKEAVYYEGMVEVKRYLDEGGSVEKLYSAKIGLADLQFTEIPTGIIIPDRIKKYLKK